VGSSRLLALFIREGIFYFVSIAAFNVLNAIFMSQSNANTQNINCARSSARVPSVHADHPAQASSRSF
jgi:hypothetical protein